MHLAWEVGFLVQVVQVLDQGCPLFPSQPAKYPLELWTLASMKDLEPWMPTILEDADSLASACVFSICIWGIRCPLQIWSYPLVQLDNQGEPQNLTLFGAGCSETFLTNSCGSVSYLQLWTMSSNLLLLETAPPSHAGDCPSILVCVLFWLQDSRPPAFFLLSLCWLTLSISVTHLLHSCTLSSPICSLLLPSLLKHSLPSISLLSFPFYLILL